MHTYIYKGYPAMTGQMLSIRDDFPQVKGWLPTGVVHLCEVSAHKRCLPARGVCLLQVSIYRRVHPWSGKISAHRQGLPNHGRCLSVYWSFLPLGGICLSAWQTFKGEGEWTTMCNLHASSFPIPSSLKCRRSVYRKGLCPRGVHY